MFPLIEFNIGDTVLSLVTYELLSRLQWVSIPLMDILHEEKKETYD